MGFERRPVKGQFNTMVYGTVAASACYHSTPDCPVMSDYEGRRDANKPVRYDSDKAAFTAGHLRPCGVCMKYIAVHLEGETYMRLTVEQLETLRIIKRLTADPTTRLKLKDIAAARRCHVSTCYVLVRVLQKKKLIRKDYEAGARKARSGTIRPTELADKVLKKMENY